MEEIQPASRLGKAAEATGIAIDVLSVSRNSLNVACAVETGGNLAQIGGTVAAGLGIVGGGLGILIGGSMIYKEVANLRKDYQTRNYEGAFCHSLWGVAGAAYGVVSGGLVIANAATLAHAANVAAIGGHIFMPAGFVMYGVIAIRSGYGLAVDGLFRHDLNQAMKEGKSEAQSLQAGLTFLYDQVHGGKTEAELKKKWDRFAFRTSEAVCRYVREKVTPELIQKVDKGDPSAIKEAKFIIQEVKKENAKQMVKHIVCAVIAILGIISLVCAILFGGPIVPALFAIGAVLWLLVDSSYIHKKLGDLFCGKSLTPPPKNPVPTLAERTKFYTTNGIEPPPFLQIKSA